MVVVPIGAVVLLVLAILRKVQDASEPVSGPIGHPVLVAVVLLALLCLGIGLPVRTAAGRVTRRVLERRVFEQIPGYRLAKAFTGDGPLAEHGGRALRPDLAAIEDGQCPARDGRARGRTAGGLCTSLARADVGRGLRLRAGQGDVSERASAALRCRIPFLTQAARDASARSASGSVERPVRRADPWCWREPFVARDRDTHPIGKQTEDVGDPLPDVRN